LISQVVLWGISMAKRAGRLYPIVFTSTGSQYLSCNSAGGENRPVTTFDGTTASPEL
jgi:hypothetical protein